MQGVECSNCGCPLSKPFSAIVCGSEGTETYKNKVPARVKNDEGVVIVYRHDDCRKQRRKRYVSRGPSTVLAPMRGPVEYEKGGVRVKARDGRILLLMPVVENLQE